MRIAIGALFLLISLIAVAAPLTMQPAYQYTLDTFHGLWYEPVRSHLRAADIDIEGLQGDVQVYYDSHGIPHIFAEHEYDAFMVYGWIQASQRFFEMDLERRLVYGRLSELVGEDALKTDMFMRNLQLYVSVNESYNLLRQMAATDPVVAKTLEALKAFTRGVNEYLRTHDPSIEYQLLGVKPEPWSVRDSIAVAKLITYQLAFDTSDVDRLFLTYTVGLDIIARLKLDTQPYNEPIIKGDSYKDYIDDFMGYSFAYPGYRYIDPFQVPINTTEKSFTGAPTGGPLGVRGANMDWAPPYRQFMGASNNWMVSGTVSETGKPVLLNDPHLTLTAPPVWFEAHLVAQDTGLNVYGVSFPGIPFIVIGRTEHAAWGDTDSFIDTIDWYYYVWDNDGRYYYNGSWIEPQKVVEKIRVRHGDHFEIVNFTVYKTVHGPIFTRQYGNVNMSFAMRWTGLEPSLVAVWAYAINHAESIFDYARAQQYFDAPIQNMIVADDQGNILYSPTGLIPVRNPIPVLVKGGVRVVNYGLLPFNGSAGEGEWVGYVDYPYIPRLLNPPEGYVITANNRILSYGEYPFELQSYYCDSYRYERIAEMMNSSLGDGVVSIDELKTMQLDVTSVAMREIVPKLISLVSTITNFPPEARQALALLSNWDYKMDADRPEPAIAFLWVLLVHYDMWYPLLNASSVPMDYCLAKAEVTSYILDRLAAGDPYMINVFTGEDPDKFVARRLVEAIQMLSAFYNNKPIQEWRWGQLHYYKFTNPIFGQVLPWFAYPEKPANGGPYTINVAPQRPDDPRKSLPPVAHGPSIRFVAPLGTEEAGWLMTPGGENGNPLSDHFEDLYLEWVNWQYHTIAMPSEPDGLPGTPESDYIIQVFHPSGG